MQYRFESCRSNKPKDLMRTIDSACVGVKRKGMGLTDNTAFLQAVIVGSTPIYATINIQATKSTTRVRSFLHCRQRMLKVRNVLEYLEVRYRYTVSLMPAQDLIPCARIVLITREAKRMVTYAAGGHH